jgi:hypothetical protein
MTHWWVRLLVGSVGLFVWAAVYLAVRFGKCDLRSWQSTLTVLALVSFAALTFCEITNRNHLASLFQGNFSGMLVASLWLRQHHKMPDSSNITTLNISSPRDYAKKGAQP